jgi:prepilin-type N-terminal cleavage/methylation domain-containing protein
MEKKGFTLVELMMVVATIGILSAVSISAFKKYQAKIRTVDAKIQLASIYSAESAARNDWGTYVSCLNAIGIDAPDDTNASTRHYTAMVGLDWPVIINFGASDGDATWGNTFVRNKYGIPNCNHAMGNFWVNGAKASSSCHAKMTISELADCVSWAVQPTLAMTATSFSASAGGHIGSCSADYGLGVCHVNVDLWNINENKKITYLRKTY